MILGHLDPVAPYRFDQLLAIWSRFAFPAFNHVHDGGAWRVIRQGDGLALLRVDMTGQIELLAQRGTIDQALLLDRARRWLGATADLGDFYEMARSNDAMWRVIQPLVGLPLWRTASFYEALVTIIIEQHISWVAAQRAQVALVQWANTRIEHDGRSYYAMPTPRQLAQARVDDLKPLKITFRRMQLLIDLSQQIVTGQLDLGALAQVPVQAVYERLLAIKGIGHWTATNAIGRARGVYLVVPDNDVALQAAVNFYFFNSEGRATRDQVHAVFAPLGDYAGLAAHFTLLRWVLDRYPVAVQSGSA